MASVVDNLNTIKANYAVLLATETAYQLANGAKPSYSLDGESYDWPGWEEAVLRKIKMLNELIQTEDGAFEVRSYSQ